MESKMKGLISILKIDFLVTKLYLCSIKFLDNVFIFFAGITYTHKFHLPMVREQGVPNDLDNRKGRFPSRNGAVFNIPENAYRRDTAGHAELKN